MSKIKSLEVFHNSYVKNTPEKAIIDDYLMIIGSCEHFLNKIKFSMCINSRVLKHLYDKKPAEEFDFIITHLIDIVCAPDRAYKNKIPKRGDYVFTKKIFGDEYFCALEIVEQSLLVVTAFRIRKKSYVRDYELLWNWRGDIPSS